MKMMTWMNMMTKKYRKIPVEIEAVHHDSFNQKTLDALVAFGEGDVTVDYQNEKVFVKTINGVVTVNKNEYIIKGVNGEFYPCDYEIFHKTYEEVQ